jgi:hypothetical protein
MQRVNVNTWVPFPRIAQKCAMLAGDDNQGMVCFVFSHGAYQFFVTRTP